MTEVEFHRGKNLRKRESALAAGNNYAKTFLAYFAQKSFVIL